MLKGLLECCDPRPKKGGWAPGSYTAICKDCDKHFVGDKRAWICADCAYQTSPQHPGNSTKTLLTIEQVRHRLSTTHVLIAEDATRRFFYIPAGRIFYAADSSAEGVEFQSTKMAEAVRFWNELITNEVA